MLEDKKLKESSKIIRDLIKEGTIAKPKEGTTKFFLEKSSQSISVAQRLSELEKEEGLTTSLWVINASYYSMFYAATALLARYGYRINSEIGIHRLTYHALTHYFVLEDNKLEKHFMEEYKDAIDQAEELLQLSETRSNELIRDFNNEMIKRKIFTYELGKIAESSKANTSLSRAKRFILVIERMIKDD